MTEALWWYESSGTQAGPISHSALVQLIRAGGLGASVRVWRSGMAGWEPLASVPELAAALPPSYRSGAAGPRATASPLPPGMDVVPTGAVIGLGLLTLGIYPMVKFYQAALAYEDLAGRRSRFVLYFWLTLALALGGGPLHVLGGVPGVFAHVAALVLAVFTLSEVLALRAEVVRRCAAPPTVTSDTAHKALFIVGLLTSWLLVGVVLLVVQNVKFFTDHGAIVEALRSRGLAPGPGGDGASPSPLTT
jgi:hypothetical protein